MDQLLIEGPAQLKGSVRISSSKNASLPILAGVLLASSPIRFRNLPKLADVKTMLKILAKLGVKVEHQENQVLLDSSTLSSFEATYDMVKTMRASILVLGPLLARNHRASVSLPGGCAIGARPIDIHLTGLEKMGATIDLRDGYVEASTRGLLGTTLVLPFPSVGATENLMMAATLAKGTTLIKNAAMEPEIEDLANFLNQMGAKIFKAGSSEIEIQGVDELKGTDYEVIGDRIEAATYIMAGIMTNSHIIVENFNPVHLHAVFEVLREMGAQFRLLDNGVEILPRGELKGVQIDTAPYPGFPTDVQAQLMALATLAETPSMITEHIFENRFMHVPELNRMGAHIILKGNTAFIPGHRPLTRAPVMCTDLRASAALILAALVVEGETQISRIYHLDRGYEEIDKKLGALGVKVSRVDDRKRGT